MVTNTKIRSRSAAALMLAAGIAAGAAAQQPAEPAPPAEQRAEPAPRAQPDPGAARARAEAERLRAQARAVAREAQREERDERRAQLERARAELEAAAREVARLAAETTAPVVADLARRLPAAAPRATLGLLAENADGALRVLNVTPNGPAAEAGIATGDRIVAIDGERLDGERPLQALNERLGELEPGAPVTLTVVRDGAERDIAATTREIERPWRLFGRDGIPGDLRLPRLEALNTPAFPGFGLRGAFDIWESMQLVALTPDLGRYFGTERGMLVVRAPEHDGLGLRDGDVILAIGDREPSSPEHASGILASYEPGETLRMTIMRDGARDVLELEIPDPNGR